MQGPKWVIFFVVVSNVQIMVSPFAVMLNSLLSDTVASTDKEFGYIFFIEITGIFNFGIWFVNVLQCNKFIIENRQGDVLSTFD